MRRWKEGGVARRRRLSPGRTAVGSVGGGESKFFTRCEAFFSTSAEQQSSVSFSIYTPVGRPLVAQHEVAMAQCLGHMTLIFFLYESRTEVAKT